MMNHTWGYARVSAADQNLARQLVAMEREGISEGNIYSDKASGKDFQRENYIKLVGTPECPGILQDGDLLVIMSIDRLGRDYDEIQEQWRYITKQIGADIKVIDMPLLDTRSADGSLDRTFIADLTLQILSYVAEKERSMIRERQRAGIAVKKAKGGYSGANHFGRKRRYRDPVLFEELFQQFENAEINLGEAAAKLDIATGTLSTYFKARRETGPGYDVNKKCGVW